MNDKPLFQGRDSMYDCSVDIGVDPRNIAQRIMDVRLHARPEMIYISLNLRSNTGIAFFGCPHNFFVFLTEGAKGNGSYCMKG